MSPAGPESASNESKIQQEQLRLDTLDGRAADQRVEGTDAPTDEKIVERTQTYFGRVNLVQARIRTSRERIERAKDMRNPNWPALEKACNEVETNLVSRLVAVNAGNLESGIPAFRTAIDSFLQSLQPENIRNPVSFAAGNNDPERLRKRSDEAYNVGLVDARRVGGIRLVSACGDVIRANEAELAVLRSLLQGEDRNTYDPFARYGERIAALNAALPGYRKEREDTLATLATDQTTLQLLCDRSDEAWKVYAASRAGTDRQQQVSAMETLLDVNDEELRHLGRYSNPGTINDKTGETVTARMERIRQAMPRYRSEYEQLRGRTPESGADTPGIPVRQLLEQLSAGSGIEPKLLEDYAKTATEVYGETALRKVVARVALVNKMSPAVCEAAALPFRPPVDVRQLVTQLGRGVLPVRPSPEQTVTVTNAYLLTAPEDSVRLRYESVLDRISVPQKQIAEYQRFIENETKGLANETREDADEEVVKRLTQNIRKTRENIAVEQQKITAMQQVLFHFEAALAVFEATSLKFEGKQQESDRVYLKLREKYGPDLARMDADLEKRVVEAIDGLRKRNQLTPYELAVVEGRQQDAVRLAVDRQQNQTPDSDLLAQARGPRRQVNIDTLRNPRRILPADEPPITEFGGKRIAGLRRERGGKILIDDEAINGGNKYRKQCLRLPLKCITRTR